MLRRRKRTSQPHAGIAQFGSSACLVSRRSRVRGLVPAPSVCSAVWQRTCFGNRGSGVRASTHGPFNAGIDSRPVSGPGSITERMGLARVFNHGERPRPAPGTALKAVGPGDRLRVGTSRSPPEATTTKDGVRHPYPTAQGSKTRQLGFGTATRTKPAVACGLPDLPDAWQAKAMQSCPKDHSRQNVKPMRIVASPRVPIDGKLGSSCQRKERCRSGQTAHVGNVMVAEMRRQGSTPCLSASIPPLVAGVIWRLAERPPIHSNSMPAGSPAANIESGAQAQAEDGQPEVLAQMPAVWWVRGA